MSAISLQPNYWTLITSLEFFSCNCDSKYMEMFSKTNSVGKEQPHFLTTFRFWYIYTILGGRQWKSAFAERQGQTKVDIEVVHAKK